MAEPLELTDEAKIWFNQAIVMRANYYRWKQIQAMFKGRVGRWLTQAETKAISRAATELKIQRATELEHERNARRAGL